MSQFNTKLSKLIESLNKQVETDLTTLHKIEETANNIGKSWSGSWLGDQAFVYYRNFESPPPGAKFSVDWGLIETFGGQGSVGHWVQYNKSLVEEVIINQKDNLDLKTIEKLALTAKEDFIDIKEAALSLIEAHILKTQKNDNYIDSLINKIKECSILLEKDYINTLMPRKNYVITRDQNALSMGYIVAPHIEIIAKLKAIESPFRQINELNKLLNRLLRYIDDSSEQTMEIINNKYDQNKIFIVHGHNETLKSSIARFLEQLRLTPIILHEQANGGLTIIEKIDKYTDVGFGIILYTNCDKGRANSETELRDRARQNVVFEHGYLIAKLGRNRVCAILENNNIETPSDISGVLWLNHAGNWKLDLVKELEDVGYVIDRNLIK